MSLNFRHLIFAFAMDAPFLAIAALFLVYLMRRAVWKRKRRRGKNCSFFCPPSIRSGNADAFYADVLPAHRILCLEARQDADVEEDDQGDPETPTKSFKPPTQTDSSRRAGRRHRSCGTKSRFSPPNIRDYSENQSLYITEGKKLSQTRPSGSGDTYAKFNRRFTVTLVSLKEARLYAPSLLTATVPGTPNNSSNSEW